jgi:predicted TIM-barrel fold metal-dependent hydrolase
VLYDAMGEVAMIELIASEYPDVDFIIPHLSSFADHWEAQLAFLDHLERHPNVYTDTSGVRRYDLLEQGLRRAGAHKILFGTDGPWLHPGVEIAKVRLLPMSDSERRLVLCENFLRLTRTARQATPGVFHATAAS